MFRNCCLLFCVCFCGVALAAFVCCVLLVLLLLFGCVSVFLFFFFACVRFVILPCPQNAGQAECAQAFK